MTDLREAAKRALYVAPTAQPAPHEDMRVYDAIAANYTSAPQPAREPLTDEQMLACVRSIGLIAPMGLMRDRGPYEVTEPTWFLKQLVRAIEAAHGIHEKT